MSSPANPSSSLSMFFQTAEIRVLFHRRCLWSNYKSANVLVSSRIYWKEAKKDATDQPQSFGHLRNLNPLELIRLSDASWKDVDEIVIVDNHDRRPRISGHSRLHGRTLRQQLFSFRMYELKSFRTHPKNARSGCREYVLASHPGTSCNSK